MDSLARDGSLPSAPEASLALRTLHWAYDQALAGIPGTPSAEELGAEYRDAEGSLDEQVDRLIRWQVAKCGAAGFLSGVGGALVLPVSVPANVSSVLYVQLRMIAAIAHMSGHPVRSDRVRTLAFACICGGAATDLVKEAGVRVTAKMTERALSRISAEAIARLNAKVGFKLVAKVGSRGVVNLSKVVPVVGGTVGALFDGASTYAVGRIAKRTFEAPA